MKITRSLLLLVGSVGSAAASIGPGGGTTNIRHPASSFWTPISVGFRQASSRLLPPAADGTSDVRAFPKNIDTIRGGGGKEVEVTGGKPCGKFLSNAYKATGAATIAAWGTIVYTTVRSNQPQGVMVPCWQHPNANRLCVIGAVPFMYAAFKTLADAASKAESWDELATPTCRRHNLALAASCAGSAFWVNFADVFTKIPESGLSHQCYNGAWKAGLMGAYGSAALLSAAVWARSLPDDVRKKPLSWPGRIADGVSKSLCSLTPANTDDPVNVKYSILTATLLTFTAIPILCPHPYTAAFTATGRRLSRAFPAWTLLAATTCFDLKEAAETNTLLVDEKYRGLSNGIRGFGAIYMASKAFVLFGDPSWPGHYAAITQVPGLAALGLGTMALSLRSDE